MDDNGFFFVLCVCAREQKIRFFLLHVNALYSYNDNNTYVDELNIFDNTHVQIYIFFALYLRSAKYNIYTILSHAIYRLGLVHNYATTIVHIQSCSSSIHIQQCIIQYQQQQLVANIFCSSLFATSIATTITIIANNTFY